MLWTLVPDLVLAALLVATIVFAARLNNRLVVLRADRDRLHELIAGLQQATRAAEEGVRGLKLSAAESGRDLQNAVDRAGALRDDLAFLVERGSALADRLEAATRGRPEPAARAETAPARVERPPMTQPGAPPPDLRQRREPSIDPARAAEPAEPNVATPQSRSERELQRLLEGRR
jgi:chromosome segregation ATPase